MEFDITIPKGHHKSCKYCGEFFRSVRSDAKFCSADCRTKHYKRKVKRKARWEKIKAVFRFTTRTIRPQRDYSRMTFLLSVIGSIGSLGFYFGVLRQVYNNAPQREKIEQLETENQELKVMIKNLNVEKKK